MAITAQQVKELRELTGCGIMDCKKALTETDGNVEKAIDWFREKGMAKADKKAGRAAAEGVVCSEIAADGKSGVMLEVNIETDFAANTDKFKTFVETIKNHLVETKAADMDAFLATSINGVDVDTFRKSAVGDIGENIAVRRFVRYEAQGDGAVASYIHAGGRVGVLVNFDCDSASAVNSDEFKAFAKDIGMQIAASNPSWICEADVPASEIERETEVITNKAIAEGKPEQIIATRIVPGQIKNFYKLNCLLNQEFVKDDEMTVQAYIDSVAKNLGCQISVNAFTRFGLGEGVEKKEDDFAAEVMAQAGR